LPGSLLFIGRYAFDGNSNLPNLRLPVSANNYKWNDSSGSIHDAGGIVGNKSYSYVARVSYTLTE
jgi:hypothetical protein